MFRFKHIGSGLEEIKKYQSGQMNEDILDFEIACMKLNDVESAIFTLLQKDNKFKVENFDCSAYLNVFTRKVDIHVCDQCSLDKAGQERISKLAEDALFEFLKARRLGFKLPTNVLFGY